MGPVTGELLLPDGTSSVSIPKGNSNFPVFCHGTFSLLSPTTTVRLLDQCPTGT